MDGWEVSKSNIGVRCHEPFRVSRWLSSSSWEDAPGTTPERSSPWDEVVNDIPENETVVSYSNTSVAENEELREIVRKTVEYYKDGGSSTGMMAASPRAVERFEALPTRYVEYRNEMVEVTVLIQS